MDLNMFSKLSLFKLFQDKIANLLHLLHTGAKQTPDTTLNYGAP